MTQERLPEAYSVVAKQLQGCGDLKAAERYWVEGRQWQAAVQMYAEGGQWQDALRVALRARGTAAGREVAYAWCASLSLPDVAAVLGDIGMVADAIAYASEVWSWIKC